jgi:putative cardiolipin synthase
MSATNILAPPKRLNFHDLDMLLLGPVVRQAEDIFDAFWNSAAAIPIKALAGRRKRSLAELHRRLSALVASDLRALLERSASASRSTPCSATVRVHWTDQARSSPIRPRRSAERAAQNG